MASAPKEKSPESPLIQFRCPADVEKQFRANLASLGWRKDDLLRALVKNFNGLFEVNEGELTWAPVLVTAEEAARSTAGGSYQQSEPREIAVSDDAIDSLAEAVADRVEEIMATRRKTKASR